MVFSNCRLEGWDMSGLGCQLGTFFSTVNDIDLKCKSGKDPSAIFMLYLKPECCKQAYCRIKHYIYFNKEVNIAADAFKKLLPTEHVLNWIELKLIMYNFMMLPSCFVNKGQSWVWHCRSYCLISRDKFAVTFDLFPLCSSSISSLLCCSTIVYQGWALCVRLF